MDNYLDQAYEERTHIEDDETDYRDYEPYVGDDWGIEDEEDWDEDTSYYNEGLEADADAWHSQYDYD